MAWSSKSVSKNADTLNVRLFQDGRRLSHGQVHQMWETNPDFAHFYSETILESGFESLCWETPPITASNLDDDHEFVVVNSPRLQFRAADPSPFQEHFHIADERVIGFPNLGRNGIMIVPVPPPGGADYAHFADFLKNAPANVISELWHIVARELKTSIGSEPKWLSTAGLGVSWLHVRIDSQPKYYRHEPYRAIA